TSGQIGAYDSFQAHASDDGRWVIFTSYSNNLDTLDVDTQPDVYIRDRALGTTQLLVGAPGTNMTVYSNDLSGDGRWALYSKSEYLNPGPPPSGSISRAWRLDRSSGNAVPMTAGHEMSFGVALTDDGRYVLYLGAPYDPSVPLPVYQLYLRDLQTGAN